MSSDLYQYDQFSDSDIESDSDGEVGQNTTAKKRQKDTSPNLEDFIPSEKRAKFAKKYGNFLSGGRSLHFGTDGKDSAGDSAAKEEEEEPDSDLEILREEEARQAIKSQKEQQRQELLQAKKREKKSRASGAKSQPEETWKDRQLVARSRAWLKKNTDVQDDEDDIEVALGDTSDEESPFPRGKFNRHNQEQGHKAPASNPAGANALEIEEQGDLKSPDFTTAVPSASKDVVIVNVQDKAGHVLQIRVKTKRTFEKLFRAFREQAAGWLPAANSECRFIFDGDVVKETDTPADLDLENDDQIDVLYS